jgi:DNA-directed RNA polymerase specialized sigma24 family protein
VVEFAHPVGLHNLRRVSPLSLRRDRAERLLREEFESLRERVLAGARGRLRANGASLDQGDLEACYAQAWQGLYAAVLEGRQIENPTGWLVLVTFRRAIDEHRARARVGCAGELRLGDDGAHGTLDSETLLAPGVERDFAAELDDRTRLRQLFEGVRGQLAGREREAATLCYLQGLSRSEAAARMGISDKRMRKLMEGRGPGSPGVAGKVGALVETIRDGAWCEQQGSLMRALAYGILDPDGERHRLALMHRDECSACRAYVLSLRGLAAALPPMLLPGGLGAGVLARVAEGAHASGQAGVAGAGGAAGNGAAALSASGAAGAGGAAGGGWMLGAGPLAGKLAVGCLLALGVGAGCVALDAGRLAHGSRHRHHSASRLSASAAGAAGADRPIGPTGGIGQSPAAGARGDGASSLARSARASREFGPERALTSGAAGVASATARQARAARSATSGSPAPTPAPVTSAAAGLGGEASGTDSAAAEREFSPG